MRPFLTLHKAKRPLLAFGAGVRGSEGTARILAELLGIPVVVTWGARDMFPEAIGAFGTHGTKAANMAVQECDWLLTVGTRLDTKSTGSPASWFAPKALRYMVDIDICEIEKFKHLDLQVEGICMDSAEFLDDARARVHAVISEDGSWPDFAEWRAHCDAVNAANPPGPGAPYEIMAELSKLLRSDDVVVSDTGCVVAWAMQALKMPLGCRFIHAWNMTPMGYGLPAAIGAAFATGKRVILLTGDGGLSVNITEMATLAKHKLPVKILLFNNRGHAMCRQTQRVWLDGAYHGTGDEDLATPNFQMIARAYGINNCAAYSLQDALRLNHPDVSNSIFKEYEIDPDQGVSPQVKFGDPLA